MAKRLARQVKSWYPAAPSTISLKYPPIIGSVLVHFDPQLERYVFSLVTKNRYHYNSTYESVLASLYELREKVIDAGIQHLSLPKLASGYDNLDFNIVFKLICQVFDSIYNHLHSFACKDPVQSSSALNPPQKPKKPEQFSSKFKKSTKIQKILILKSSYLNRSRESIVRTWIIYCSEKVLSDRSDLSYN